MGSDIEENNMHQKDRIPSKHYRNETTESIGVG